MPVLKVKTYETFSIFSLKIYIFRLKICIFKLQIGIFSLKIENIPYTFKFFVPGKGLFGKYFVPLNPVKQHKNKTAMNNLRDWFYFSAGERRALTVLSLLIIGIWVALWWTEPEPIPEPMDENIPGDTIRTVLQTETDDSLARLVPKPQPPKQQEKRTKTYREARQFQPSHAARKQSKRYVSNKFPRGTVVELNSADSLTLRKVPGIGEAFSRRIVKYRDLLGGFYSVTQLAEVYGIDEERYAALAPWFCVDTTLIRPILVNQADFRTLIRHPYIDKPQTIALLSVIRRKGQITGWDDLRLLEEFTPEDRRRLRPYLSFEAD